MEAIVIIDFGSQYNQLIARRVRENKVFCEIVPPHVSIESLKAKNLKGIILSGGPASIYQKNAPKLNPDFLKLGVPVLGICYGMQALSQHLGGHVRRARFREYGRAELLVSPKGGALFRGLPKRFVSWMSHGDYVARAPQGFVRTAKTKSTVMAAFENPQRKIYGVQFHPEVAHTQFGARMIENFLFGVCGCRKTWTMENFIHDEVVRIRKQVGRNRVILGLSGGVDSSVAAALVSKAVGNQLTAVFVNNGL